MPEATALPGDALEELLAFVAVHVAVQDLGPIHELRQRDRGDLPVVVDQVALGVAFLRPEDLVEVGQDELVVGGEGPVELRTAASVCRTGADATYRALSKPVSDELQRSCGRLAGYRVVPARQATI